MTITPAIRELIDSSPLAHVTDGSPQVSVVLVGLDGSEFVTAHMGDWQKVKNLRKDPRVALSLLGRDKNAMGLQEYRVVYGKARIHRGGRGGGPSAIGAHLSGARCGVSSRIVPQQTRASVHGSPAALALHDALRVSNVYSGRPVPARNVCRSTRMPLDYWVRPQIQEGGSDDVDSG
jgi:hypothetical protein